MSAEAEAVEELGAGAFCKSDLQAWVVTRECGYESGEEHGGDGGIASDVDGSGELIAQASCAAFEISYIA
jgi:hypothetical protein